MDRLKKKKLPFYNLAACALKACCAVERILLLVGKATIEKNKCTRISLYFLFFFFPSCVERNSIKTEATDTGKIAIKSTDELQIIDKTLADSVYLLLKTEKKYLRGLFTDNFNHKVYSRDTHFVEGPLTDFNQFSLNFSTNGNEYEFYGRDIDSIIYYALHSIYGRLDSNDLTIQNFLFRLCKKYDVTIYKGSLGFGLDSIYELVIYTNIRHFYSYRINRIRIL